MIARVILPFVLLAGLSSTALADSTSRALKEFGWDGTWALDCSIPDTTENGSKRVLAHVHDEIPWFGQPTRTVRMNQHGNIVTAVFTVQSAKLVAKDKVSIVMTSENNDVTETDETVLVMVNSKMVSLWNRKYGIAKRQLAAGRYSSNELNQGDHFDFISVEDGFSKNATGKVMGEAVLEKCLGE